MTLNRLDIETNASGQSRCNLTQIKCFYYHLGLTNDNNDNLRLHVVSVVNVNGAGPGMSLNNTGIAQIDVWLQQLVTLKRTQRPIAAMHNVLWLVTISDQFNLAVANLCQEYSNEYETISKSSDLHSACMTRPSCRHYRWILNLKYWIFYVEILTSLAVWFWTEFLSKSGTYYLPWRVHRDICLMTFKCTLERSTVYSHWTCTHSTAAAPTAPLSADVARCAATCDVDKLAQHRWHLAVGWKGKNFISCNWPLNATN